MADDTTHLRRRGRGFQRALEDVDDPVGGQDVRVGDETLVDVEGRLRRQDKLTLTLKLKASQQLRSEPITDQSRWVQHVGHAQHAQTAHTRPQLGPVLQTVHRKSLTLRQVELDVPLSQRLQGQTGGDSSRWGQLQVGTAHLVLWQTTVVRDKEGGLDGEVTQTLHKSPPLLRHLREVQDLLQKTENRVEQQEAGSGFNRKCAAPVDR